MQETSKTALEEARRALHDAVAHRLEDIGESKVAAAIQAVVWQDGELLLDEALGQTFFATQREPRPPAHINPRALTPDTPMDIASLTKPLVAATLIMQAVDEGLASFDTPIADILPEWLKGEVAEPEFKREQATLLHLLNHSSGLPAWERFYLRLPLNPDLKTAQRTRRVILDEILNTPLEAEPGARHRYSDLGYILLAELLERIFGQNLQTLARDRIFEPLGMKKTCYIALEDGDSPLIDAAATEACALRQRLVIGTVHDENTEIIGGVSGHAGVFSTARDLLKFARHLLEIDQGKSGGIISQRSLKFCLSEAARAAKNSEAPGHHLGGWDTPSGAQSSAGRGFSAGQTFGHLGFSGTSIWVERRSKTVAILLTNRVYPTRENQLIKPLRVRFHEAILAPRA